MNRYKQLEMEKFLSISAQTLQASVGMSKLSEFPKGVWYKTNFFTQLLDFILNW